MSESETPVGRMISEWLTARRMSQRELARAVGVTPGAVWSWIASATYPSFPRFERVCDALGVSRAEFFRGPHIPSAREEPRP